jgi:RNA polymerase primary sigma factor
MRQLRINKSITNRENNSLDKYLQEIWREDMITAEKESELAQRIKQGDLAALQELTKANLRFVVSVAKQYQNQWLALPDLINEGNLGLIKAAQRFDETRGFKFISYAVWRIRQSILNALAEASRIVRLPLNKIANLNSIHKASRILEQTYYREPTNEELAKALEWDIKDIKNIKGQGEKHFSLDEHTDPTHPDDGMTLMDIIAVTPEKESPDHNLVAQSLSKEIERVLTTITPRESDIIKMFYWIGYENRLTLAEIGEKFDLTRERVRQIKGIAIRKLKSKGRSKLLKKYLG